MKHWIDFLEPKTHTKNRIGKLANTLTYEVEEKELQLQNAKANLHRYEIQFCNKIASNYNSEIDFENAVACAKHKAENWNNSPIDSHQPTHKNK
jgi:hypothetical protein